ncbi:MAG TPA: cellulase family glycosylhydrolase [Sphingomicrobium sp.]|nr:cellulase family glycosylhydrolase [Sphingomicrobium sp.]
MNLLRSAFALLLFVFAGCASAQTPPPQLGMDSPFRRGVNVLGYDPYWKAGGTPRFQWRYFGEIHRAGFDFVRLNLQAFQFMDAQNRLQPQWLAKLDTVVNQATKAGLGILIDEHDFNTCSADANMCRAKLTAFWQQVAPRFAAAPRSVAFEILNEPHDQLNGDVWNQLFAQELAIVRQTNPTRIVVVGPTHWNGIGDLPLLKLPPDPNLLVTFHYYNPMTFTHQGASWAGPELQKLHGVTWGTAADRAAVTADFDKVRAWADANHRPILLGEFGAFDLSGTPVQYRAAYADAVARAAEAHHFGWAWWQFDGNFILWDEKANGWNEPILKALIPGTKAGRPGERG